jgi:hypothetical protein
MMKAGGRAIEAAGAAVAMGVADEAGAAGAAGARHPWPKSVQADGPAVGC